MLQLAEALRDLRDPTTIRGLCYLSKEVPKDYLLLPSFEEVSTDQSAFIKMFHIFYHNNDPLTAKGLAQRKGDRYLIQNPPALTLSQASLDKIYTFHISVRSILTTSSRERLKRWKRSAFQSQPTAVVTGSAIFARSPFTKGVRYLLAALNPFLVKPARSQDHPEFKGIIR